MLFNSYEFIFLFLPITFILYFYLLSQRLILGAKIFLVILEKCEKINNPIVRINSQPQNIRNENSENKNKLLFLCDSFGTAPSQLYNGTFNSIFKFHWSHLNGQKLATFVEINKPDVVIYQIVERDLYNDKIVFSMPEIIETSNVKNFGNSIFDISKCNYFKNNDLEVVVENNNIKLNAISNDPVIILNETKVTSKNVILNYEIESSIDTTFQLFYKKEKNSIYNQIDSYKSHIKKGNNKINLLIPSEYINNELRVDLVSNIGNYKIKEFKIFEIE